MTVLSSLQPLQAKVGLVAWYVEQRDEILVPLRVCEGKQDGPDDVVELVVLGAQAVKSASLEVLGQNKEPVHRAEHKCFFAKGVGIPFRIPAARLSSSARIRVKVEWADDGFKILERDTRIR
jgi:hypothetical protein